MTPYMYEKNTEKSEQSLELKKFSFLYGYNRILYVNDIPAITAILESFPVHDCTLSFSIYALFSLQFPMQIFLGELNCFMYEYVYSENNAVISLELKKFSFLYGYNRILYVNDIPAITAILESFPVHDCTLSFR
ncbi:hypothetical protein Anas_06591 [Armadillidium nasatum]|uniref:Uncharacterized protein n=1 Tax=Armadillidium nasatum TaxID=96803 RepID=A0A5N5TD07_9CRUS|nr:hypothetical protein Anas_06591 [Armadillidium nasatum]